MVLTVVELMEMELPDPRAIPPPNGAPASKKDIEELEANARFLTDNRLEDTHYEHTYVNLDGGIIIFRTDSHEWETANLPEGETATHPSITIAQDDAKNVLLSVRFRAANQIEPFPTVEQQNIVAVLGILTHTKDERAHSENELAILDYVEMMAGNILWRRGNFTPTNNMVRIDSGERVHIADAIRQVVYEETDYGIVTRKYQEPLPNGEKLTVISRKLIDNFTRDPDTDNMPTLEIQLDGMLREEGWRYDAIRYHYQRLQDNRYHLMGRVLQLVNEGNEISSRGEIVLSAATAAAEWKAAGMDKPGRDDVKHLTTALFKACMQSIELQSDRII